MIKITGKTIYGTTFIKKIDGEAEKPTKTN